MIFDQYIENIRLLKKNLKTIVINSIMPTPTQILFVLAASLNLNQSKSTDYQWNLTDSNS